MRELMQQQPQRAAEQRATEQRATEQRAAEQRAAKAAEQRVDAALPPGWIEDVGRDGQRAWVHVELGVATTTRPFLHREYELPPGWIEDVGSDGQRVWVHIELGVATTTRPFLHRHHPDLPPPPPPRGHVAGPKHLRAMREGGGGGGGLPARPRLPSGLSTRDMLLDPQDPPRTFAHSEWCGVRDALYNFGDAIVDPSDPNSRAQDMAMTMHYAGHYYGEVFSFTAHQCGRLFVEAALVVLLGRHHTGLVSIPRLCHELAPGPHSSMIALLNDLNEFARRANHDKSADITPGDKPSMVEKVLIVARYVLTNVLGCDPEPYTEDTIPHDPVGFPIALASTKDLFRGPSNTRPLTFCQAEWVEVRNQLNDAGESQAGDYAYRFKRAAMAMNLLQHYYLDVPMIVGHQGGRLFGERAMAILELEHNVQTSDIRMADRIAAMQAKVPPFIHDAFEELRKKGNKVDHIILGGVEGLASHEQVIVAENVYTIARFLVDNIEGLIKKQGAKS
uniref:Uncharacterized protein n=1 Tax=Rhizochromulina marina TaxID=1034831 RepID=A0A7S2R6S2_9STRA